ncbi:hypothetical protein HYZ05_01415 [Candidatus Daviesbacteria bacterium]|nr:hypothetical protein [Candidatus Daviesbacteria bacterium]
MTHQLTNHLITASVGRFDDDHFNGMVWIKDGVRAVKFALDPNFQQAFPQLTKPAKSLYLSSVRALLQIQAQPAQLWRFQNRPSIDAGNGYVTIDDRQAPAIKFTQDGLIYHDWGHNQPDNWGTLLLEVGKGIEAGWPVLEKGQNQAIPLGSIMQEVTSYVVGLRTERLVCRSIWEHKKAWSSYSTRRIVLAGLEKTEQIWPELITDSRKRAYPLKVTRQQLEDAIGRLREKVKEHFPADYTDSEGHESSADLASIVVLNDIDLPDDESSEILERARELENRQGFYRYLGDPWKQGRAEAKWTMGKPIMARYYFRLARRLYEQGKAREAYRSLGRGLDKIDDMIAIINTYGYIPEIFEDRQKDGVYRPNNNELAWTHGDIIEATSAGIVALETSERFYQKVA